MRLSAALSTRGSGPFSSQLSALSTQLMKGKIKISPGKDFVDTLFKQFREGRSVSGFVLSAIHPRSAAGEASAVLGSRMPVGAARVLPS